MSESATVAAARRPGLLVGGMVLLAAMAGYAFLMSPTFRLQRITVSGTSHVTPERVAWATDLKQGDLRWRQDSGDIRRRLLQAEPWLADAEIKWEWGGILTVAGKERQPVALIPYHNLAAVVDEKGRILELGALTDFRLPVITGVGVARALRGDIISGEGLAGALEAAHLMPRSLVPELGEIHVGRDSELTLRFTGPISVRLGRQEVLDEKLLALAGVFSDARREQMNVDLINPARPVLVPRK